MFLSTTKKPNDPALLLPQFCQYQGQGQGQTTRTLLSRRQRRVVFCETKNQSYANTQLYQEDTADMWYNQEDYQRFHEETRQQIAQTLSTGQTSSFNKESWAIPLWQVYRAFRIATNPTQVQPVLDAAVQENGVVLDETNVGLERMALPDVMHDYWQRRKELLQQVWSFQQQHYIAGLSVHERDVYLAQMVSRYSRVSRLYARWTAHLAADLF